MILYGRTWVSLLVSTEEVISAVTALLTAISLLTPIIAVADTSKRMQAWSATQLEDF